MFQVSITLRGAGAGRFGIIVFVTVVLIRIISWARGGAMGQGADDVSFANGTCSASSGEPRRSASS